MDHVLPQLNAIDIRTRLPRANWEIGRRSKTTSVTVHYNGPATSLSAQSGEGLIQQLTIDANWQMRPGWGNTTNGSDGLQYHLVIASDGRIYQARDLDAMLWHCAAADGNTNGLAVHLPLGGTQAPTDAQWVAVVRLLETLRQYYAIPMSRVLGHIEWKHATQCPGPIVQPRVVAYRSGSGPYLPPTDDPAGLSKYQVISTDNLNIRQGPGTEFPVAGTLKPGSIIYVDVVKPNNWMHLAKVENEQSDLGFCSGQYLQKLS